MGRQWLIVFSCFVLFIFDSAVPYIVQASPELALYLWVGWGEVGVSACLSSTQNLGHRNYIWPLVLYIAVAPLIHRGPCPKSLSWCLSSWIVPNPIYVHYASLLHICLSWSLSYKLAQRITTNNKIQHEQQYTVPRMTRIWSEHILIFPECCSAWLTKTLGSERRLLREKGNDRQAGCWASRCMGKGRGLESWQDLGEEADNGCLQHRAVLCNGRQLPAPWCSWLVKLAF